MDKKISIGPIKKTESNTIKYRLASFGDKENIKNTILRALESDPNAYTATLTEYKTASDDWWNGYLDPYVWSFDHFMYFAELDGEIIGMVGLVKNSDQKKSHSGKVVWLWVDKDFRRIGIGRELMNKVLEKARSDSKIVKISLDVIGSQVGAIKLYRKFGFLENGRMIKEIYQNDKFYDLITMEYFINRENSVSNTEEIIKLR
ncbi:MAG: GNAT family N-acetyltransferase [Candidatus Dojkabacteria bacterium]